MPDDGFGEVDGAGAADVVGEDGAGDGVVTETTFPDPAPAADAEFVVEESAAVVEVAAGTVVVLLETVLVIGSVPPPQLASATMEAARKSDLYPDG